MYIMIFSIVFCLFILYNEIKEGKMFIKKNDLVAIYVHVSWKTSFSYEEYCEYEKFMQFEYFKKGDPMRILLTDSTPSIFNKEIHYIYDKEKQIIKCPEGIGVKESYKHLQECMSQSMLDELSKLTQKYFDYKYPKEEMQM